MEDFKQRVVKEKSDLDEKRTKLEVFIASDAFKATVSEGEQERLKRQAMIMKDYSQVLTERIVSF